RVFAGTRHFPLQLVKFFSELPDPLVNCILFLQAVFWRKRLAILGAEPSPQLAVPLGKSLDLSPQPAAALLRGWFGIWLGRWLHRGALQHAINSPSYTPTRD